MKIMHTMASEVIAGRPKRRCYSPELKTQVAAECQAPGASVAGVALAHGINANIVHRWLREHARDGLSIASQGFVPLTLEAGAVEPFRATAMPVEIKRDIRIEVRRGTGSVSVNWPLEGAVSCAAWLALLRWTRAPAPIPPWPGSSPSSAPPTPTTPTCSPTSAPTV